MMGTGALQGAIIAAGQGTRLRSGGWTVPKALVPVGGVTLMEHVIGNFRRAGVSPVTIIVNADSRECVDWAHGRFPGVDLRFIVETTASSLQSFLTVLRAMGRGPALISTVDAWCPDGAFDRFAAAVRHLPRGAAALAVTAFVDDEKPLWASTNGEGRIVALGAHDGNAVTAGLYLMPDRVRHMAIPPGLARLRDFLAWLLTQALPVHGVEVGQVIDIDRPHDITCARGAARQGE